MPFAFLPIRNGLLGSIPSTQLAPFEAALRPQILLRGRVVYDGGRPLDNIYFIETGIVSLTVDVGDSVWVEVGMAGREGMVGSSALLTPAPVAKHRAVVLLPGEALVVRSRDFHVMIKRIPRLSGLVHQSTRKLTILDRAGLEAEACVCHRIIRSAEAYLENK
jgi:CRP-like cAMP-binding protein